MLHCSKTFTIMLEKSPLMLSKLTVMLNENSLKSPLLADVAVIQRRR